jgi:hypothetical protein
VLPQMIYSANKLKAIRNESRLELGLTFRAAFILNNNRLIP